MSMIQERPTLAFRWVLPITQLVLCVVVLWPLRATLVQQVKHSIHAYQPLKTPSPKPSENQQFHILLLDPMNPQQRWALEASEKREWMPMILNLPSGLVQFPYVVLNPAKQDWIPREMDFKTWRAISWPLVGILFWWSAGRGIEALLAARRNLVYPRIGWIETIVGAALFTFCGVAAICLPLYGGVDDDFPVKLWVAGSGTWANAGRGNGSSTGGTVADPKAWGLTNVTKAFSGVGLRSCDKF
jgi:hypothetical protein